MRILYVDIDTLRPDHLRRCGYPRNTSPNIDALAARGVRFTRTYASDAPCLPGRTALFTGRPGMQTGVVNHGGRMADIRPQGPGRPFNNVRGPFHSWMQCLAAALSTRGGTSSATRPVCARPAGRTASPGWPAPAFADDDAERDGPHSAAPVRPLA